MREASRRVGAEVKDINVRRASRLHKHLYQLSNGRFGDRLVNNDMLLLTTIGTKTGKRHTIPLLYLEDRAGLVIVASYGGRAHHPQWYLNLVAEPAVDVQIGATITAVNARITDGEERAHLWTCVVAAYPGYATYQDRTGREIPLVVLEPI